MARCTLFLCTLMVLSYVGIVDFGASLKDPVIGIVTQPCDVFICGTSKAKQYLPASYVKWAESGGAQVIPLFPNATKSEISNYLKEINGVVIPGGAASSNPSGSFEKYIMALMQEMRHISQSSQSSKPISVPLWGTCNGFENMLASVAKSGYNILDNDYDASNLALSIDFNDNLIHNSTLFTVDLATSKYSNLLVDYSDLVIDIYATSNTSYNDHSMGTTPTKFMNDPYVSSNFSLLGTSKDRNAKEFVTMYESFKELNLNWFGVQFHPEKISYEFSNSFNNCPHTFDAVISNMYLINAFIEIVRNANNNTMSNAQYAKNSICNYQPVYTESPFEQVYLFY